MPQRSLPIRSALASVFVATFLACGGGGGDTKTTPPPVPGPHLSTSPAAQAGYVGDQVTYRVVANGSGLSYQWLKNGTAIPSATMDSLVVTVAGADDQARFSVRVTAYAGGLTTSPEAILDALILLQQKIDRSPLDAFGRLRSQP